MRSLCAVSTCAVAAVIAIGCGGGDDELTKSEFLKQGNAICAKGNKEIDASANKTFEKGQQPTKAQITKFAEDTLIPSVEGQINDIRELDPPSELDDQVDAFLDGAETALDKTKDDPSIVASNQDPFKETNKEATRIGLKACAG